jgi:hypothetical protein
LVVALPRHPSPTAGIQAKHAWNSLIVEAPHGFPLSPHDWSDPSLTAMCSGGISSPRRGEGSSWIPAFAGMTKLEAYRGGDRDPSARRKRCTRWPCAARFREVHAVSAPRPFWASVVVDDLTRNACSSLSSAVVVGPAPPHISPPPDELELAEVVEDGRRGVVVASPPSAAARVAAGAAPAAGSVAAHSASGHASGHADARAAGRRDPALVVLVTELDVVGAGDEVTGREQGREPDESQPSLCRAGHVERDLRGSPSDHDTGAAGEVATATATR